MKIMTGMVKSVSSDRTVVVKVDHKWKHPLYKKYVKRSKTYASDVQDMALTIGDTVVIQECRPISKNKHFKVIEKK